MTKLDINDFPPKGLADNPNISRKLIAATQEISYLDGIKDSLPNPNLILQTLPLQEAQDSSEIENIVTTSDELYQSRAGATKVSVATKEVNSYVHGMELGIERLEAEQNLITISNILAIQEAVVGNDAGFRNQAGTVIKNQGTGEILHTPPQDPEQIKKLMAKLLKYINLENGENPLIKMALIHFQFESIHPFFDGNGRTGRILNLLYLIKEKQLSRPILYLSRFINHNKNNYYRLLQKVRNDGNWEEWVIYMLTGIEKTAAQTTHLIKQIKQEFSAQKEDIRNNYSFYSHELLNHIYAYPYTRRAHLANDLDLDVRTAKKYLDELSEGGILKKVDAGYEYYYINYKLTSMLATAPSLTIKKSA